MQDDTTVGQSDGARIQTGDASDSLTAPADKQRAQPTPGPWRVFMDAHGRLTEIAAPCYEHRDCGKTIVFVSSGTMARPFQCSIGPSTEANAMLIAAAPDLLEACRDFIDRYENKRRGTLDFSYDEIKAAIAKAEGR